MSGPESPYFTIIGITTAVAISLYFLVPLVFNIGSSTKGPVVPGLRNWANWCFCNSVVQSLASIPSFRRWLDQELPEGDAPSEKYAAKTVEDPEKNELLLPRGSYPLSRTVRGMMDVLNIEGPSKVLSASPLVKALEVLQKSQISRSQQDAQEFLHMLLESIAAEQNHLPVTESLQQMANQSVKQGRKYKALPFEGAIKNVNTCTKCGHELKAEISPFLELTLLPPQQSQITLNECIASTLQGEYVEDYNCVHCQISQLKSCGQDTTTFEEALAKDGNYDLPKDIQKSHVTLKRSASITTLPQILILHINRSLFGAYATRNPINVTYSDFLILQSTEYELRSFVIHQGSHDRGHYISYRRKSGKWYVVSDETVRTVDIATVLSMGGSTFLMFYEKIDRARKEEKKKKKKKANRRKSGDKEMTDTLPKSKI